MAASRVAASTWTHIWRSGTGWITVPARDLPRATGTTQTHAVRARFAPRERRANGDARDGGGLHAAQDALPVQIATIDRTEGRPGDAVHPQTHAARTHVMIPPRPEPPGAEECCMSGCAHCVYDIYADEKQEYEAALVAARTELTGRGIPESQWPPEVVAAGAAEIQAPSSPQSASIDAFLALERKMAAKRSHPGG